MKKFTCLFVASLLSICAFAQQNILSGDNAVFVFLKNSGTKITEKEYLNYAKVFHNDTYDKYKNDEFEWDDQFTKIKEEYKKTLDAVDLSAEYVIGCNVDFGDYDFTNEGFPVKIDESTFFPLEKFTSFKAERDSVFYKSCGLRLLTLHKYNFFKIPKAEAKTFLQKRRSNSGYIDREVFLQITYNIVPYDAKEFKQSKDILISNGYNPIGAQIKSIEVYDPKTTKKIADLIIK